MAYFVIAGKPDCGHLVHCLYIADYLDKHLPHFKFRSVQFLSGEWETWLVNINKKNGWFHTTSPLIWKEVNRRGGKPYIIGGISDFWEYVYDYYGLQSVLPIKTLNILTQNNEILFNSTREMEETQDRNIRQIIIYGAADPIVAILLPALNDIPGLGLSMGIQFILYQPDITIAEEDYLEELIEDFKIINTNISLSLYLEASADLIIFTQSYLGGTIDNFDNFLIQQTIHMREISALISRTSKRGVRIVLANNGPVCFNANILLSNCSLLRHSNVVAVTADLGLSRIRAAATLLRLPLTDLGAPPVWGSIGLTLTSAFVDLGSAIQRGRVYRPYARALRVGASSTLALGTVQTELRFLNYLSDSLDVEEVVHNREVVIQHRLGRKQHLSKVRATLDVIRMWYAEKETGDIISLGVASDGSFNLPNGLFFSQPVMLHDKSWKPVGNFPVSEKAKEQIAALVPEAIKRVEDFLLK